MNGCFGSVAVVHESTSPTAALEWKADEGTKPSVLYIGHEPWMEEKANTGVQLSEDDKDVTYEQNNLEGGKL